MSKTTKELQSLSKVELQQRIDELKNELVQQKRARAAGELMNSQAIKKTRRTIAVALTLISNASDAKKEEA
ncbi:MAG: 50S ribosomal protein L29 [Candidatus Woesebacteria bacterium]|jgi:ribosomal protein L29